jgi:heme/copper-type cytochrome/quinol oxidase subunit 2
MKFFALAFKMKEEGAVMKKFNRFFLVILLTFFLVAGSWLVIRRAGIAQQQQSVEIKIVGDYQNGWTPSTINVWLGEKVTLDVSSDDYTHELLIPAFHVDSGSVSSGQTVQVTFVPNKTGSFPFLCKFHSNMTGTLVVSPKPKTQ